MITGSTHRFLVVLVPIVLATVLAGTIFGYTLSRDGFGPLEAALVVLFIGLFAWIAFWFWLTSIGAWCVHRARRQLSVAATSPDSHAVAPPLPLTAVVIPIHNEAAESVFARIEAMLESVAETGNRAAFEFFVLSDTSEPDIWLREEVCWAALRRERRDPPVLYYRRRPNKFRRKSGNIAEFCERWGRRYRYMIVLDADSVMDGKTMNELVNRMEHAPRLGILQAPSLPAMRHSFYARVQQFAASVYGPPIFAGLAYCFQDHGKFLGSQRHRSNGRLHRTLRAPGTSGSASVRRPHSEPRFRRSWADAARWLRRPVGMGPPAR